MIFLRNDYLFYYTTFSRVCVSETYTILPFLIWNAAVLKHMFFFLLSKQSFQCLTKSLYGSSKCRCLITTARGTWNFAWKPATLAQGCAREVHMSTDVNLHRLPDKVIYCPKFPVPLAAVRWHLQSTDSAAILTKQAERQFIIKKNTHYKNCWHFISDKDNPLWINVIFSVQNLSLFRNCLLYLSNICIV